MKASPNNMHIEYFWPAIEPAVCPHATTIVASDTNTNTNTNTTILTALLEETVRYP